MRHHLVLSLVLSLALSLVTLSCREPKKTTPPRDPEPEPIGKLTAVGGPDLSAVQKLLGESKFDDALVLIAKELAAYPDHPKLLFFQGFAHFNKKDFDKALVSFTAVRKRSAGSLELTISLSETLFYLKKYDECEQVLREGMLKFPKAAALWYNLGGIHAEKQDLGSAKKMYAEALLREPDFGPALYSLADLHASEKDFDRAAELLARLAQQDKYRELAHTRLAIVLSYQKKWDEALSRVDELEKLNPEGAKLLREKIRVSRAFGELGELIKAKKCKDARARFELIKKEFPGSAALSKAQDLIARDCPR